MSTDTVAPTLIFYMAKGREAQFFGAKVQRIIDKRAKKRIISQKKADNNPVLKKKDYLCANKNRIKSVKTFISRNLIQGLVLPLCFSSTALSAADKKIVVLADTHVMAPALLDDPGNKEWQTYLKTCKTMQDLSVPIFDTMVEKIIAEKPDRLLIVGDLTKDGEVESHQYVLEKLTKIKDSGIKLYVIPGNHDRGWMQRALVYANDTSTPATQIDNDRFGELYADYGYGGDTERYEGSLTYKAQLFPGLTLFGIDSGIWCTFREGCIDWVCDEARKEQEKGNQVIVMMHHTVMPHYYYQNNIFELSVPEDYEEIRQKFTAAGIKVVLSGHSHASDIARFTDSQGNELYDINTGSPISYPCDYRTLTFDDQFNTLKITTNSLTKLDGFEDFPAYAKERLKTSVQNWTKKWFREKTEGTIYAPDDEQSEEEEEEEGSDNLLASVLSQSLANCFTVFAEGNESRNPESKVDVIMFDDLLYFIQRFDIDEVKLIEDISLSMKSVLGDYPNEAEKDNIVDDRELTIQMPSLTSGISDIPTADSSDDCWFTLQGTRLEQKPSRQGVYIHNGRKVIIR